MPRGQCICMRACLQAATVPIRLILAWSARVLIYFSPCWSLWVSAVCNIALLLLLVLFLRSCRLTLHLYTAAFLLFVYTFCAGVGLAAVAVYYSTHSPSRHSSCSVAIAWGVLTTIALIAVAVYLCTCRRPSGEGPEEEPRGKQDTILVRDPPLMDKAAPSRFVPGCVCPRSVLWLWFRLRLHALIVISPPIAGRRLHPRLMSSFWMMSFDTQKRSCLASRIG